MRPAVSGWCDLRNARTWSIVFSSKSGVSSGITSIRHHEHRRLAGPDELARHAVHEVRAHAIEAL